MSVQEYIESGVLELYVFGKLSENEILEVNEMAGRHEEVRQEILAIESAVINLSYTVAPYLSAENYDKIRQRLIERQEAVVTMNTKRSNFTQYLGWAASLILLLGLGFQYYKNVEAEEEVKAVVKQRSKFEQMVADLRIRNTQNENALNVVRDKFSTVVPLAGQAAAPEAYAKVYVNRDKKEIYVDVAGLPEPPKGKVYQVWALKLNPLTPQSIGIIENKEANKGIHKVENFENAEAFGITLEPAGGSPSPTMEQLYTLGKV